MSCSVVHCGVESSHFLSCSAGHTIHRECAREWAVRVPDCFSCPLCRSQMDVRAILSRGEVVEARALGDRATGEDILAFANDVIAEADRAIANDRKYSWREIAQIIALFPPVFAFVNWVDGNA